jgi:hypothetical protein
LRIGLRKAPLVSNSKANRLRGAALLDVEDFAIL